MKSNRETVDVVFISVPYCEPLPLVAPVLLAGCLTNAGIPARGIDFNIEFLKSFRDDPYYVEFKNFLTMGHLVRPQFPKSFYRKIIRFTKKFLVDCYQTYRFKYIGISIFSSESLDFGLILSYLIRKHLPQVKILAGGKGLEVNGPDGLRIGQRWIDQGVADTVVVGDAESEVIAVVKENKTGLVVSPQQKKEDLDNIPLAKWDDYDLQIYSSMSQDGGDVEPYLAITASKGCVRQCAFCDVASFWPDYIYRDPVKVAEEMIHNYRATGIKSFQFTDNLINGSISNYRIMNQVLVNELPRTLAYSGYAIFRGKHQMPEDDFRLASEAGCKKWRIGVESGSEKIRNDMRKKFDNEDLDWSINMLHRYGINQDWLFIVGYPSETEDDFQQTLAMIKSYSWLAKTNTVTISITPTFMLLKNSPLIMDPTLRDYYGLEQVDYSDPMMNKFWSSTKYLDNDYPTRSRRWKTLVSLTEDLGFDLTQAMPIQKWQAEIENTDKIYAEQKHKFIPILASK